jgi:hypothetical protein
MSGIFAPEADLDRAIGPVAGLPVGFPANLRAIQRAKRLSSGLAWLTKTILRCVGISDVTVPFGDKTLARFVLRSVPGFAGSFFPKGE